MTSLTVYFQPENSEVPAKRMMNALNAVYHGTSDKHIDLRRFLLGQSPKTPHPLDFLDALSQSQKEQVETLKRKHRPDQQTAFQRVEKSKGSAFILGPPRSGKSYFISTLTQMVAGVAKKKVLITCPSNAAVDALAKTINNDAPELGAVRYHSLPFESGATENSLRAHHVQKPQSEDVEAEQEDDEDPDRLESPQQYSNLMHFAIQQSKSYNTKQTRPNFQNMSLMAGCLKSAGLPDDENTKVDSDVARGFRGVFRRGPNGDYGERNLTFKETVKEALEALQVEVLTEATVVITAMSNSGDKLQRNHYFPNLGISDEVANSTEPETLIMWAGFLEHMDFFLGVG
ncbi:MAG: hypothetical protein Q9211_002713 [Gyalolechia sp. 1 TL-2023]